MWFEFSSFSTVHKLVRRLYSVSINEIPLQGTNLTERHGFYTASSVDLFMLQLLYMKVDVDGIVIVFFDMFSNSMFSNCF